MVCHFRATPPFGSLKYNLRIPVKGREVTVKNKSRLLAQCPTNLCCVWWMVFIFVFLSVFWSLPTFAHVTPTPPETTEGWSPWGKILCMNAAMSIEDSSKMEFKLTKIEGVFEENNEVFLILDSNDPEAPGATVIAKGTAKAGDLEWKYVHNFNPFSGTKSFYFRVRNIKGEAFVGPIVVEYSNVEPDAPAVIKELYYGNVWQSLTYSYKASDPDGDKVRVRINWGDDSGIWTSGLVDSGSQLTHSHAYGAASTYDLTVEVIDEHGIKSTVRSIEVEITGQGGPEPTVMLKTPNYGTFKVGDTMNISWGSNNQHHFGLYLLKGGVPVGTIYHVDVSGANSYSWQIPPTIEGHTINGSNYKIKIAVWNNAGKSIGDESDGVIAFNENLVGAATVEIISPGSGAIISGSDVKIRANVNCEIGIKHIKLYVNGLLIDEEKLHHEITSYNYEYPWDTTSLNNDSYKIKIVAYDKRMKTTESEIIVIIQNIPIRLENFNFANITRWGNMFTSWFDMTDKDGNPLKQDEYELHIVKADNPSIVYANAGLQVVQGRQWKVLFSFDIENSHHGGNSLYFEDGVLQIKRIADGVTFEYTPVLISAYGTMFDVAVHGFKFRNGDWEFSDPEYMDAAEVVLNYIKGYEEGVFWEYILWIFRGENKGECYGMINSAIANYVYRNTFGYWGSDTDSWVEAIENRGFPPTENLKPFSSYNTYENTWDKDNGWKLEAAKKIMYYHVAQSEYHPYSMDKASWIGKDTNYNPRLDAILNIIKCGSPVALTINFSYGGWHQLAITQIIKWNDNLKLVVYDPNVPYSDSENNYAHFREIWFDGIYGEGILNFSNRELCYSNKTDGNGAYCEKLQSGEMLTIGGDSQYIYGFQCNSFIAGTTSNQYTSNKKTPQKNSNTEKINSYVKKGYLKCLGSP